MRNLSERERTIFRRLSSPIRIQAYLDTLPFNFEKRGATNMSPRRVIQEHKAHCMEGAMFAAAALSLHGQKPLLLDLTSARGDDDHVVALYRVHGYWGAISKTNHAVLRFRDPIYRTVRELALSYFHEYFMNRDGRKMLRSYAGPFNLKQFGKTWVTADEDLWYIAHALDTVPHWRLIPRQNQKYIRPADPVERRAGRLVEWRKKDPRT